MIPELSIPLLVLLIPYALFILFYLFYSIFNVYHLLRYGLFGYAGFLLIVVYAGASLFLLAVSTYQILQFDWMQSLSSTSVFGTTSEENIFSPFIE